MGCDLPRRTLLQLISGAAAGVSTPVAHALAASNDAATIGWPNDVPSWDPNQRFTPDAQPIFKAVFDQPLDQDPQLKPSDDIFNSCAVMLDRPLPARTLRPHRDPRFSTRRPGRAAETSVPCRSQS